MWQEREFVPIDRLFGNINRGRGKGKKRQRSGTALPDLNVDILQDDGAQEVPLTQNAPPPEDI
jgi:hypothetical protein